MLFLSPGIVYWVENLLHWCDSNAVFVVDISRVYANSSSEDGKKQNQRVHTLHFWKISEWYTKKR